MFLRRLPTSPTTFIAWAAGDNRPRSLAAAVGGTFRVFGDLGIVWKPLVPLRYVINGFRTVGYLLRTLPGGVVMQAPPVPALLIPWLYCRVMGVPFVIDSHPSSFAIGGGGADRAMKPLLGWLAPRAAACLVTTEPLAEEIGSWGGRGLPIHEAPPAWPTAHPPEPGAKALVVIYICTFAPDEPLSQVVQAARALPEVTIRITGDKRRLPAEIERTAPPNVEWLGYLTGDSYPQALSDAAFILTLDERNESVPRSAYEAVYALRPLITSDWPHMRTLFPEAVFVSNDAQGIESGIRHAVEQRIELDARVGSAADRQASRWTSQLQDLQATLNPSLAR